MPQEEKATSAKPREKREAFVFGLGGPWGTGSVGGKAGSKGDEPQDAGRGRMCSIDSGENWSKLLLKWYQKGSRRAAGWWMGGY